MWKYYRQNYANGVWVLFREDEKRNQEIFHRQNGWTTDNELFVRRSKGEVDENDRVSETEALALIQTMNSSSL